jgi:hypothetical protein
MLKCDKCGGTVPEGSSFCPHCADPITESDSVLQSITSDGIAQVEISFGQSSSASYEPALEMCRRLPTYAMTGENNSLKHYIKLPITEIELLINLYELVGSWKSSRMLINGQAATKSALVYHGAGCYRDQLKAFDRRMFCFGEKEYDLNIWGCKRLGMSLLYGEWLKHGHMDRQGVWTFDKERIKHDLELAIHEVDLCPVLDRKRVLDTLERLPNTVDPKVDKQWQYTTEYRDTKDGGYREVAVGVSPLLKKASGFIVDEYRPHWGSMTVNHGGDQANSTKTTQQTTTPPSRTTPAVSRKSSCMLLCAECMSIVCAIIFILVNI